MQAEGLPAIMNITEYFAAQYDGNGKFECEHGPTECAGNLIELCAYNLTIQSSQYGWWNFGVCMQDDYNNIPGNAKACATKASLNYDPIQTCANNKLGVELFVDSINYCNQMNIEATPTLIVNGVVYIGGTDDPLSVICNAYTGTWPSGCGWSNRKKSSSPSRPKKIKPLSKRKKHL
jgi:interferon gamma-inducible protein 30